MKRNSAEYWNTLWNSKNTQEEDNRVFNRNSNSILWQRMMRIINENYTNASDNILNSIEVGAGTGEFSALLQNAGIQTSLLDFSEKSELRSREFFENNSVQYKS